VTNSVKKVCVIPIQEKKIIFEKHNCVHMHTHYNKRIQRVTDNYAAQQNNF
jgi:Mg2+ and Co2+ transporter CorA